MDKDLFPLATKKERLLIEMIGKLKKILVAKDEHLIEVLWQEYQQASVDFSVNEARLSRLLSDKSIDSERIRKFNQRKYGRLVDNWRMISDALIKRWDQEKSRLGVDVNNLKILSNYGSIKYLATRTAG
ncbi:MAG: hypothetical protein JJV97_03475 [SAR324 cluster bacterium]|nr:hypothetical protein [SAR324 cluster bacterium]